MIGEALKKGDRKKKDNTQRKRGAQERTRPKETFSPE